MQVFKIDRDVFTKNVVVTGKQKKEIVDLIIFDVFMVGLIMLANFLDHKKILYFPGELK